MKQAKEAEGTQETSSQSQWVFIVSVLLLAGVLLSYFAIPQFQQFIDEAIRVLTSDDQDQMERWMAGFGPWGAVFILAAMVAQMFLVVIPSVVLMVLSTLAYGPLWGSLLSFAAVLIASSVAYYIGLHAGNAFVDKLIGEKAEKKVNGYVEQYGVWAIVLFRVSPFLSNDAISFVAGIGEMRYVKFIAATAGGIIPLIAVIAYVGKDTETLETSMVWVFVATVVAFAGYLGYKKLKEN